MSREQDEQSITPATIVNEDGDWIIPGWLTLKQASKIAGVSPNALTWDIKRNRIARVQKFHGRWLVEEQALREFIDGKKTWMTKRGGKSSRDRIRKLKAEMAAKQEKEREHTD